MLCSLLYSREDNVVTNRDPHGLATIALASCVKHCGQGRNSPELRTICRRLLRMLLAPHFLLFFAMLPVLPSPAPDIVRVKPPI